MNKEIMEQWVAALKSGQYLEAKEPQKSNGVFLLCTPDETGRYYWSSYGVLCNLHSIAKNHRWSNRTEPHYYGMYVLLAHPVEKWSGHKSTFHWACKTFAEAIVALEADLKTPQVEMRW
jgi:hypothetical protein